MKLGLKKVFESIIPSKEEEKTLKKSYTDFLKTIKADLKKYKAEAVLGGSIGKGTWLRGDHDIDIFILFKDEKDISNTLEKILKKSFKSTERIHGSRDYFRIKFNNYSFELVPVLKIKKINEAKNVTDCSVFHIKWVNKKTTKKLKNEIRLVKQFCKSAKVYGAETYIKGLSGYVLEILTVYFKSFNGFVKGILKLKEGTIIDLSRHKKALDRNKLSPIILIDPVQGDRNAAAALSQEKFNALKSRCLAFQKSPTLAFFLIKKPGLESLKKKFQIVLELKPLEGKDDVVGTKILKVFEYIRDKLNLTGFIVTGSHWEFQTPTYLSFSVKNKEISQEYLHLGPPIASLEHAESFREKYKGFKVFEQSNRLAVILKRDNYKIDDFINSLLKDSYVLERVKGIKRIA